VNAQEKIVDDYLVYWGLSDARLGDHLCTLDQLREAEKQTALRAFGFPADPEKLEGNLRNLVESHLERYDKHMGAYLRYSHVLLTYIVFESRIYAFSSVLAATRKDAQIFKSNGNKSLIEQFEAYLKLLSITLPGQQAHNDVEDLRLIRNCIVHCNGSIDGLRETDKQKLQARLKVRSGISIDEEGKLTLTTECCLTLQDSVFQYMRHVDKAADFRLWIPDAVRRNFEENIAPHLNQGA
jgi:hypothetical protein